MRIALAGNPNSGKTTMYNALTGRSEDVGNWAGVTVDKKESPLKKTYQDTDEDIIIVDLPGAYSMSAFTSEESVASEYIKNENPDVLINIVDATNIARSLFFTTQLLELGIPTVVALNKSDINEKNETLIDSDKLSQRLGCPVINTISTSERGVRELIKVACEMRNKNQEVPFRMSDSELRDVSDGKAVDRRRYEFVKDIVSEVERRRVESIEKTKSDKIDAILTHQFFGIIIFAAVMYLVFFISQSTIGAWIADVLVGWIESFKSWIGSMMTDANPLLYAILVDGIIGGVGAVIGFLPLVMVMYFLIALLEDCGYMSRATVVLNPIFKKVGLSGKSVIPMVIGTGCGIPAIMSCRTIRNDRERKASAMLATFMPCGAKIPVIALFAGAFFSDAPWVGPLMYFMGIVLVLLGALIVKGITGMKYRKTFFIIEMPEYKLPGMGIAVSSMLERGKEYIIKAGTVILVCNTVVQIMQSFDTDFNLIQKGMESTSILAALARPFGILLIPIVGFSAWQLAAASITGFIAKENIVGTLATVYTISNFIDMDEMALISGGDTVAEIMGLSKAAALAYLMFNLYIPPCFAALGALNAELRSAKWMVGAICLQLATGYTVGFIVYQGGTLISTGGFGPGFLGGLAAVVIFVIVITLLTVRANRLVKKEYEYFRE